MMMKVLAAGDLRHRITLQTLSGSTQDAYGQVTPIWTDVATYWAALAPQKGRNITVAGQVESLVSHAITMRYLGTGVRLSPATNRFRLGSRIFSIVDALDVEERHSTYSVPVTEIQG